jgi:putative DNA primase/helicase
MQRSIVINMERAPRNVELKRFDLENGEQIELFQGLYQRLFYWSRQVTLNRNPLMPKELRNRRADNWRVLLAIANACDRGEMARATAIALSQEHKDEDAGVELLTDIRRIFDRRGVDRLASAEVVTDLCAINDASWCEWCGARGNQQPRRMSQGELAKLLKSFRITPQTIWPSGPREGTKSARGYYRHQFEAAWGSYCSDGEADTPTQSNNIRQLRPAQSRHTAGTPEPKH